MDSNTLDAFLNGPLIQWLQTLPESPHELGLEELTSGDFLHNVLQSLDANIPTTTPRPDSNAFRARVSNVQLLLDKLKLYYEDTLGQSVVIALPNPLVMCQDPAGVQSLKELDTLLLLILGAAVQCSQKESIIASIKNLPVEVQHAFVEKIKDVTENPQKIWPAELSNPKRLDPRVKDDYYKVLVSHVKRLVKERDGFAHQIVEISLQSPNLDSNGKEVDSMSGLTPEKNHMALEVSESKAKIRKLNQQLEEKTETLSEAKEELERTTALASKLRQENLDLSQDARAAKAFRDELDILRERASKVDKLEAEMQRYKDKVSDIEFFKSRVEELREDNKILVDTKEMLESQLESSRKRSEMIMTLENEILRYKSEINQVHLDRESDKQKLEELQEENYALQMSTKNSFSESQSLLAEMQSLKGSSRGKDTNILTEQIDKDVTKIHRLELEVQRLTSELEDAKVNGFHESSSRILDLEKANKKYSITLKQLEVQHTKDSDYNTEVEKELSQKVTQVTQLEEVVSTLKESEEQIRIEKDTEIDNLTKQVNSMRKRQEQNTNEQVCHLEEENRKLVKERTLLQTQVSKLNHENQRMLTKTEELSANMETFEEMKAEKEKLNSRLEDLLKETDDLKDVKENMEKSSEQTDKLKLENAKLAKSVDKLNTINHELSIENARLSSELQNLKRKNERLTAENARLGPLENDRDDLRETINKLRINIDTLSDASKKSDEQEQKISSLSSENGRLQRQIQTFNRKLEDLKSEQSSLEAENRAQEKNIVTLKANARKMDQLEKENVELESSQHKMEREQKSLIKEIERIKASIEAKESSIEELHSTNVTIERENKKMKRELETSAADSVRVGELQAENRKLAQDNSMDKRSLMKLREELVEEKMRCDQLSNELDELNSKLNKLGIDQTVLNGEEEFISNERMRNLEGSMNNLLDTRQKKIGVLESALKEANEEKSALHQEVECLKMKVQAGNSKAGLETQLTKVVREKDKLQSELLCLKTEASTHKENISVYENKIKKVHEEMFKYQVENSTLQSQSSSLLSQINQLQGSLADLEGFKRKSAESEKRWQAERSELLKDQAGLQKLHDNLQQDYESLVKEKEAQKETERKLRADLRKLQSMSMHLSEGQDDLLRAKEAIDAERESLRADAKTLSNLRSEHARLKDDFRSLFTSNERVKGEYGTLQSEYKSLKTSYNQMKLQQTELKGQIHESKEQISFIDVEYSKVQNRCEVLAQMNESLEDDRKSLMTQVTMLLAQYQDLLNQTLDDKEHFHEEEKFFTDRVNNLHRQKEKLEEKIMEQYKRMESATPKKPGQIKQMIRKMKKITTTGANRQPALTGPSSGSLLAGGVVATMPSNARARSNSRGRLGGSLHGTNGAGEDGHDSSSVGSGGNDSLESGQNSPPSDLLVRSISSGEIGLGVGSRDLALNRGSRGQFPGVGRSGRLNNLPRHLEDDSDGNHADNDSVSSLVSGVSYMHMQGSVNERIIDSESREILPSPSNHSDLGIPVTPKPETRYRPGITRVYVNGNGEQDSHRSTTPKLMGYKSTNSSPMGSELGDPNGPVPAVPARKSSRAGSKDVPPQLPPKPSSSSSGRSSTGHQGYEDNRFHRDRDNNTTATDSSSSTVDDNDSKKGENAENTAWYEYGCV